MLRTTLVLLALLVLSTTGAARGAPAATVLRDVRVFDGARAIERADVLISGERIAAVGVALAVPAGTAVIDGRGRTLLPGLIDAHAHVHDRGALEVAAALGVLTVIDLGGDPAVARALKAAAGPGAATLLSAGHMVTAPGGHGTEYGFEVPTLARAADAEAFVAARVAEGADVIKLVLDDGSAYGIHFASLDERTLTAAVGAAHARKRRAVVHVGTLADARAAVAAGADGLAHLFLDRPADAALVAAARHRGVFVVPTLSVLSGISGGRPGAALARDARLLPFLSAEAERGLQASFPVRKRLELEVARASVRALSAAGVDLLAGSDAPNPATAHGATVHGELAELVAAGLSPTQALAAATSVPARRLGLADRGRIAPGLRADVVLVAGDPTRDITATRAIEGVWQAGVRLDRAALSARVAAERRAAAATAAAPVPAAGTLVSDFEDGTTATRFGAGWMVSTDQLAGGESTAALAVASEGATPRSRHALEVRGTVVGEGPQRWSGAIFFPGRQPMEPADASARRTLHLDVKAAPGDYAVMLFSRARGPMPARVAFRADGRWTHLALLLERFAGIDPRELTAIFVGRTEAGAFRMLVDDVALR